MPRGAALRLPAVARAIAWQRPLIAALLTAAAAGAAMDVLAPTPPPTTRVVAATRDLPGGVVVDRSDVGLVSLPASAVPQAALRDESSAAGRVLAGPVRKGEPLTDVRLVGPALLAGFGEGLVAAPVRLTDPGIVAVLRTGDLVDILAAQPPTGVVMDDSSLSGMSGGLGGAASVVAGGVRVVTVLDPAAGSDRDFFGSAGGQPGPGDSALILIAASPETARRLAAAAVTSSLSVVVRAG